MLTISGATLRSTFSTGMAGTCLEGRWSPAPFVVSKPSSRLHFVATFCWYTAAPKLSNAPSAASCSSASVSYSCSVDQRSIFCSIYIIIIFIIFYPRQICSRGSLKIKIIHSWVQIISPCSQGLARCHVTRQCCSVAPAPKLSAEQKSSFSLVA